jgi:hypothetical protein
MNTRTSKRKREDPVIQANQATNHLADETSKYFESKENIDNGKKYWLMKSEVLFSL